MAKRKKENQGQERLFKNEIPKMPDGYYSGDKPNRNIRAFVEDKLNSDNYNIYNDKYSIAPLDSPFETSKATSLYGLHAYHQGKKSHEPIMRFIEHYTDPGDIVLDPFMGSGGTCLAALITGRAAIGIDRSPAATFIASNYCSMCDTELLEQAFEKVMDAVQEEIGWAYQTKSGSGDKADIVYQLWSQTFECQRCLQPVAVFEAIEENIMGKQGKLTTHLICPKCKENGIIEPIAYSGAKRPPIPEQSGHRFRSKAATDSDSFRPLIPEQSGHIEPL